METPPSHNRHKFYWAVAQAHLHRSFDLWRLESGSGGVESLEDKASR